MSHDNPTTGQALIEIAHELRRLGMGNACMDGKGALEVHGMYMGEHIDRVSDSLESIAEALNNVAAAIRDHGTAGE